MHLKPSLSRHCNHSFIQLDIAFKSRTEQPFQKHRMCSLVPDTRPSDTGVGASSDWWSSVDMMLPVGQFNLYLDALIMDGLRAAVWVDNVTVLDGNCSLLQTFPGCNICHLACSLLWLLYSSVLALGFIFLYLFFSCYCVAVIFFLFYCL